MVSQKKELTRKSVDISRWYTDVIQLAKLADYGPARGTMVIRPYGFAIWATIQKEFDRAVKRLGAKNGYFPLFIPMSLLQKEKKHVKGFAPELAVVTHGGGKKLAEPLAVRPTSETIMYEMYSKWISSWRDLPLAINQWNNVVRWEKRTYFFLRTLEFLWQEGHTAHATYEEAEKMAHDALLEYNKLYEDVFAIPSYVGIKSEAEQFAGADHTYTVEQLMSDGKILQGATSHHLGDNFAKAFNITFDDKDGKTKHVFQTSWGLSTRAIGGLILVHGDDAGLVLPPRLAPTRVVIIPIQKSGDTQVLKYCQEIKDELTKSKTNYPGNIEIWDNSEDSFGRKINNAEIQGIPIRLEIGKKELIDESITFVTRLTGKKEKAKRAELVKKIESTLGIIQEKMLENAKKHLKENTRNISNYEEFKKTMKTKKGFIKAYWCGSSDCETKIKEETKATARLKPLKSEGKGKCIYCGKQGELWYFGHAY